MSIELEKDVNEIKITVAIIKTKMEGFNAFIQLYTNMDDRIRKLENSYSKFLGYCAAIGTAAGAITGIILKLL